MAELVTLAPFAPIALVNAQPTLKRGATAPTLTVVVDGVKYLIDTTGADHQGMADIDIDLRFSADKATTIGDGTANGLIGLWGKNAQSGITHLLGVLGITIAIGSFPQIPIMDATHGFAQVVRMASGLYAEIGIGGVLADVTASNGALVTCTLNAIRRIEK